MTIEVYRKDDSLFEIQNYDRYGRRIEDEKFARKAFITPEFPSKVNTDVGMSDVMEMSPDLQKPGDDEVRGYINGYLPSYTWEPLTNNRPEVEIGGVTFKLKI